MKGILTVAAVLLAVYLLLSPRVSPFLYTGKVFRPEPSTDGGNDGPRICGVIPQDVYFNAPNGSRLHGWFFKLPKSNYIAIVNHGNRGNISTASHLTPVVLLLNSGVYALLYDYEGYGSSQGKPSLKGILADGKAAYDFAINKLGYKPKQIIEYGESLGCAVAGRLAVCVHCDGVILQSGFSSLERIGKDTMPILKIYPSFLFPQPRFNTAETLTQPHPPLMIIHGMQDGVVPFYHADILYKAASERKQLIALPDSAHRDILQHKEDTKIVIEAIKRFVSDLRVIDEAAS